MFTDVMAQKQDAYLAIAVLNSLALLRESSVLVMVTLSI